MKQAVFLILLCSVAYTKANHAPLPEKLLKAKTVYIDNRTYAKVTDPFFEALSKWGRFSVAQDPKKADVIFRISADGVAENSTLTVVDPSTGETIWAITRGWGSIRSSGKELVKDLRQRIEH